MELSFKQRQKMFCQIRPSFFVENFLYEKGEKQSLDLFPMMRFIYDNLPDNLILKCSRKTLKSTMLSNIITLNILRWSYYDMLYVGNLDSTAVNFSNNYVAQRLTSPYLNKIIVKGWEKNHIYEKKLGDSQSSIFFSYCENDANRVRGLSKNHVLADEVQGIAYDQLPIIMEVMATAKPKRVCYAGTPLSSGNTIHKLWVDSNQAEWVTKCGCGCWNFLHEENTPEKMLLEHGFSCVKCSRVLDTTQGEWVAFKPFVESELAGFHLAQPMLPFYNQDPIRWKQIYEKVTHYAEFNQVALYNEVLGLSYDASLAKPISERELREACILGPMLDENKNLAIIQKNKSVYKYYTFGIDWGVSNIQSRTTFCLMGVKDGGIMDVVYMKTFGNLDHESHIREMLEIINRYSAHGSVDSGPDPIRGIMVIEGMGAFGMMNAHLISYAAGRLISEFKIANRNEWRSARWHLHRSDTLSLLFRMIKKQRIFFPRWDNCSKYLQDLLNMFIEYKDGRIRQEMFYNHPPDAPDDMAHALNFAMCTAMYLMHDITLTGLNSSSE